MKKKSNPNQPRKVFHNNKGRQRITHDAEGVDLIRDGAFNAKRNDARWYAQDQQLLKDSASFPFGWPLGNRINYGSAGSTGANHYSLPGIMAIATMPTFGYSDQAHSPINVAARNIYSFVRHANSGHSNYDAPDLMLYLLSMDSVYANIAYLKRAYGVLNTASYTNRYYPKAVFQAMGLNYQSFIGRIADFRSLINTYVVKAGSMCIPASMSYMAKHMWMYDGLYTDNPSSKSQTYLFYPRSLYKFELDDDGAGSLVLYDTYTPWSDSGLKTFNDVVDIMEDLLNPILESEDMNIMSGDILKAYGSEGVFKLSSIGETYSVLPTYNESVLDQIQNLSFVGSTLSRSAMKLRQSEDKSYLIYTPQFLNSKLWLADSSGNVPGNNYFLSKRVISFPRDGVNPDMLMEATRMANIADSVTDDSNGRHAVLTYRTIGSEVALYAHIFFFEDQDGVIGDPTGKGDWFLASVQIHGSIVSSVNVGRDDDGNVVFDWPNALTSMQQHNIAVEMLGQFNRHPAAAITSNFSIVNADRTTTNYSAPYTGLLFDTDNYTILDAEDLIEMSQIALLSEFNITQYGKATEVK